MSNNNHEDIASDLSSDEGEEEDIDDEVKIYTYSDSDDVPDPGDNIDMADSEENTLTGQIMLAWKARFADLLHDLACAAFPFLPSPIVQDYVIKNDVQADWDAAKHLVVK